MRTLLGNYVLMKIFPNLDGFLSWWSQFKCSYTYLSHFSFGLQSTLENDSDGFKDQIVAKERTNCIEWTMTKHLLQWLSLIEFKLSYIH